MSGAAVAGRIVALIGAVPMVVGIFLPWEEGAIKGDSGSLVLETADIVIIVLGVLIVIFAALGLALRGRVPASLMAGFAGFAGGLAAFLPIEFDPEGMKIGVWATLAGALIAFIGAVVADVGDRWRGAPAAAPVGAARAPVPPPAAPQAPAPGAPPGPPAPPPPPPRA